MTTTQMEYFCEAAHCLNFTTAAQRLYITQSTLSRSISSLERELGLQLFERKNNVLTLTPGGEILRLTFEQVWDTLDIQIERARTANSAGTPGLSLGLLRGEMAPLTLAAALKRYRTYYPDIPVSIVMDSTENLRNSLENQQLDAAIQPVYSLKDSVHLGRRSLFQFRYCLAMQAGAPLSNRQELSLLDCRNLTIISVKREFSDWMTESILGYCNALGFMPNYLEAPDINTQIMWLESGLGVALLTEQHHDFSNPLLHFAYLTDVPPLELDYVWSQQNTNPAISVFANTILLTSQPGPMQNSQT